MYNYIKRHSTALCLLCGLTIDPTVGETLWCRYCLALFRPVPRCQRCGLKTYSSVSLCGHCLTDPPPWHRLFCVGEYQEPLSSYVHKLKYSGKYQVAYELGYLLAQTIIDPAPVITTVPLHWWRFLQRGYNQSFLLANSLEKHLAGATRVDPTIFRRRRSTVSQKGLDKVQRVRNLKDAFRMQNPPNQPHIAIVDDVVTTGSTVRQLCDFLLEVGVETIDIYCICRTEI